jgi:hypothetical protein
MRVEESDPAKKSFLSNKEEMEIEGEADQS